MASFRTYQFFQLLILASLVHFSMAAREVPKSKSSSSQIDPNMVFKYHNGTLLSGKTSVNLIFYGLFSASERAIVADFITSLSSTNPTTANQPSVATWWKPIEKYLQIANSRKKSSAPLSLYLGAQILDESCTLGKSLTNDQIKHLAAKGGQKNAINIVLTAADVTADGFCSSTCGTHGWLLGSTPTPTANGKKKISKFPYIWVGNSETQCPGQCAWPFHQPIYGPQTPPLIAPNNNVGMDGMIITAASLLADTVTNPYGNGFFQGPASAPLEAASACQGLYGDGSYPGNAGTLLEDKTTGASFNAYGINEKKYLLPALFDPSTSQCSTLV